MARVVNQGLLTELNGGVSRQSDRLSSATSGMGPEGRRWLAQVYQRYGLRRGSSGPGALERSPSLPTSASLSTRFSRFQGAARLADGVAPPPTRSLATANRVRPLTLGSAWTGKLHRSDYRHPNRKGHFVDDYLLRGDQTDQPISISLKSTEFDTYLQILDSTTGEVIAESDDAYGNSTNSRIPFTLKAGTTYRIRVTSYGANETGAYQLETARNPFDLDYGYGLVNAATAVSQAMGRSRFHPVATWGKKQWNLNLIQAPEVWANGITGDGVMVAVLDTGVDYTHSDLASNIWTNPGEIPGNGKDDDRNGFIDDVHGWNFVDGGSNNVLDSHGHGTHVAGIVAAMRNQSGSTGVAYNATILPVRVIGGQDDASLARFDRNVAHGIRYAVDNGADVLNLSLGNNPTEPPMPQTRSALVYARQQGVVVVMAAGNEKQQGVKKPIEPASYAIQGLGIAVGAIGQRRLMADFSNPAGQRPMPFLVAPGVDIWSTVPNNRFAQQGWSGTSMAAPHIAGVVALMLDANPNLTPDQVEAILIETARPQGIRVG